MSEDMARQNARAQSESAQQGRVPVLEPGYTYATVTDKISAITLSRRTPLGWWIGFGFAFVLVMVLLFAIRHYRG